MNFCLLTIESKNEKSINKFVQFFKKNIKKEFNLIKITERKKKKSVLTVLKSPHVNKTAQEQFEQRTFSKQILINSICYNKILISLKKKLFRLFSDIKVKIKLIINLKINTELLLYYFKFNYFKLLKNTYLHINKISKKNYFKNKYQCIKIKSHQFRGIQYKLKTMNILGETLIFKRSFRPKIALKSE